MEIKKTQMTLLTLGLLIILTSCNKRELNQKDEIAKLLKTDQEWAEASASNDAKRMVSFYDSAGFFVDGTRLVKGHSDLQSFWNKWMESPVYSLTWEAQGAEVSGDLGFTYGVWVNKFLRDTVTINSKGMYLTAWKKQSNGDWKVLIDKP